MIIMPSILLTVIATWMVTRGSRTVAIISWVLAILAMLGAMSYHMDSSLNIDL
jgi:heme/copper-type cytochrome/quinol oxidase subunit 4